MGCKMGLKEILYFDKPRLRSNSDEMIEFARKRIEELGVKTAVTAWDSGYTLYKLIEMREKYGLDLKIVCVTNPKGGHLWGKLVSISDETRAELEQKGIQVYYLRDYFNFGEPLDLEDDQKTRRAKLQAFGVPTHIRPMDIDVGTDLSILTIISQGFRVCVGTTVLATRQGLIPEGEFVLSIAGISTGLILRASPNARSCLVKEILGYDRKYTSTEIVKPVGFEGAD